MTARSHGGYRSAGSAVKPNLWLGLTTVGLTAATLAALPLAGGREGGAAPAKARAVPIDVVAPPEPPPPEPVPRPSSREAPAPHAKTPRPRPPRVPDLAPVPEPTSTAAALGALETGAGGDFGLSFEVAEPEAKVFDLSAVDRGPEPISRPQPPYPVSAKRRGVEGNVKVALVIDAAGNVTDARIERADPPGIFDDVVLDTVAGWRFRPAERGGRAVAVRATTTVSFSLEDG